jgi:flagellar biosynthesis/type III secretory pathway M-ring protein FliF/YscJ
MQTALAAHGIEAKILNDRLMVPVERHLEAVASLTYDDALPDKGANVWDEMFKQMSPWDPASKTDSIRNHGTELLLQQVIGRFPDVAKATVVINPKAERRIGGSVEPGASVALFTRSHDGSKVKRLRDAAAAMVSSAVSGLSRKNVTVVIDGILQRTQDSADAIGGELYDQIRMLREENEERIIRLLAPGTRVAVNVELETTSTQEHRETYDPTKTFSKEKSIENQTDETSQPSQQNAEPGALTNTSLVLNGPAPQAGGATSNSEKSKTDMVTFASKSDMTIISPAGKPTVVSAAVSLPRSVYVNRFKNQNPAAKDADEKAVQTLFELEKPSIRDTVVKALNLKSEQDLALTIYDDSAQPMLTGVGAGGGGGVETGTGGSALGAMVGTHAKEIVVGLLAAISLFMVSTIVRKGAPAPVIAAEAAPRETPRLGTTEDVAGIAGGDANTTLDAVEMDEGTIKAQQMVEQVATMVEENPDAAANLVKRWLNRS